jgi:4'-phosphopantetheinyl transferase
VIDWLVEEAGEDQALWLHGEGLEFLSLEEKRRLESLHFPRRRVEWILGRRTAKRLLRSASPAHRDTPSDTIHVFNEPGGVPFFSVDGEGRLPGCLSISHRDQIAFCAWTGEPSLKIGADLDKIETRENSFLEDYFTASEKAFASALPDAVRDLWITLAWSAKEAALKVLGVGLRMDTRKVEISRVKGLFKPEDQPVSWQTLGLHCVVLNGGSWQAWWRRRGSYVFTLAARFDEKDAKGGQVLAPSTLDIRIVPPTGMGQTKDFCGV